MARKILAMVDGEEKTLDLLVPELGAHGTIMMLKDLTGWDIQVALFHCEVARLGLNGKDITAARQSRLSSILDETEAFIVGDRPAVEFYLTREHLINMTKVEKLGWSKRGRLKYRAVRSAVLNLGRSYEYRIDLISSCYHYISMAAKNRKGEVSHFKNPYYKPEEMPIFLIQMEFAKLCHLDGIYGKTNRRLIRDPDFSLRYINDDPEFRILERQKLKHAATKAEQEDDEFLA